MSTRTKQIEHAHYCLYVLYEEQGVKPLSLDDPRLEGVLDEEIIQELVNRELVLVDRQHIHLTEHGREEGLHVVRRRRLAARLLTDVLDFPLGTEDHEAHELEHSLSPEVTYSICILLGHPRESPTGQPIPPGRCCAEAAREITSLVVPLAELRAGQEGRIAHVATKHHTRLDRLTALSLFPGSRLRVHQTFPAFVIRCGETDIALDREVAQDIYVRRIETEGEE
jgi:DtxR family Mn-dependent transcriptional regulator